MSPTAENLRSRLRKGDQKKVCPKRRGKHRSQEQLTPKKASAEIQWLDYYLDMDHAWLHQSNFIIQATVSKRLPDKFGKNSVPTANLNLFRSLKNRTHARTCKQALATCNLRVVRWIANQTRLEQPLQNEYFDGSERLQEYRNHVRHPEDIHKPRKNSMKQGYENISKMICKIYNILKFDHVRRSQNSAKRLLPQSERHNTCL